MADRRGRPTGYVMSKKTKNQISETKTGQQHTLKTRRKISKSVKEYFKTDAGKAQTVRMTAFMVDIWTSKEGLKFKKSMKEYYDTWYRED
jgi:hypothetical protein